MGYIPSEIMNNLKECIIRNKYDSIGQYGQVIRAERKKGFSDLYEVEYKYLEDRIKCTCQFDAAVYDGHIYKMFLNGGRGGHWVTDDEVEIIKNIKPVQLSLF